MDTLQSLLTSLSPTEQKQAKRFMESQHKEEAPKENVLFDLMLKYPESSSEQLIGKLYQVSEEKRIPQNVRNMYHQRRFLLCGVLEDFCVQVIQPEESTSFIVKLILIARFLLQRKKYAAAFEYLKKAEKLAIKIEQYEVLDRVYLIQIEHAWQI